MDLDRVGCGHGFSTGDTIVDPGLNPWPVRGSHQFLEPTWFKSAYVRDGASTSITYS